MNKVIGFQITAKNKDLLNNFYANSFGWGLSPGSHEHVTNLNSGNRNLDGSILWRGEYIPDYVSLFIESDDLEATISTVVKNGGTLIRPIFHQANGDHLAVVADPEGHVLTLIKKVKAD